MVATPDDSLSLSPNTFSAPATAAAQVREF